MVALHEACVAISRGDCESAIVGGTNLIMRPSCTTMMSEQGVLSPDGSCKTFSTAANGYARGEAIVGVFVKPLEDAIQAGNPIRAVIRATATNHDGKTAGFSLPSAMAQEEMIRRAYDVAGLPVSDTGYVECHGTGTSVGDPIETKAVAQVFGQAGVIIGSTKPNFGHTEGASGILSILKAVLALENKTIPPSIKYAPKNPNIPWDSGKLVLAENPLSWPEDRLERISVNSFGLGGSNAHAILDSGRSYKTPARPVDYGNTPRLFLYSANTQQSLTTLVDTYKSFLEKTSSNVGDIAYTLARGREHLPYRAFAIFNGSSLGTASPITKPSQQRPKIAMVFTGQGAQWPRMGADLLEQNSVFRSSIRALDRHLLDTLGEESPSWSIEKELLKPKKKCRLNLAEFAQPICTAIQIALVDTLRSVGVEADAVVGHSSGEIASAYAAGALTAGEAIVIALYRGIVATKQEKPGAMAALGMNITDANRFLIPGTGIACDNSPRSVTISGDADKIKHVLTTIRATHPNVLARELQVDKAYHSHHMVEIGNAYNCLIRQKMVERSPKKLFFSSVENKLLDSSTILGARYWQKNLESPVLFNGAVTSLLGHFFGQDLVLMEIGPHSALAGPLTQIMSETPNRARYIASIIRNQNSAENFLSAVGKLFTLQVPIDLEALFPNGSCLPDLPRYPFNHSNTGYWFESRLSREFRQRNYAHHDVLGAKVVESTDLEPSWRNLLHVGYNTTWLKDHKVGDDIVFPFAGYVAMAGEAVRQVTRIENAFRLRRIWVGTAMLLSEEKPVEIITTLRPLRLTVSQNSSWYEFTVSAYNGHQWIKHCSGEVKAESGALPVSTSHEALPRTVEVKRWFDGVRREGLDLGFDFHNVDGITASTTSHKSQGMISSKKHPANLLSKYHMHPAVLDSALQLLSVASSNGLPRKHKNFLPVFCDQLFIARTTEDFVMDVEISNMGNGSTSSRIGAGKGVVNGKAVIIFNGLKITPASITDESAEVTDPHAASRLTWAADIDFVDIESLFQESRSRHQYAQALRGLGRLSILSAHRQLTTLAPGKAYLERYVRWIHSQVESSDTSSDDSQTLSQKIRGLCDSLADTQVAPVAEAIDVVVSNINALSIGAVSSWETLLPAATVTSVFDFLSELDCSAFIKLVGHSRPNLRVLEISNWSRSPSTAILRSLTRPNGYKLWSKYTFATKSLIAVEEHLTGYPNMEYVTLDICANLADQGFADRQYDIIIANNALHTTPSLAQSLRNVKTLLAPAGRLFLQELATEFKWINLVLGTSPSWWRGVADDRIVEPYVSSSRWHMELGVAGFGTPDITFFDSKEGSQINCIMVVRPDDTIAMEALKPISLLVLNKNKTYDGVEKVLREQGYDITKITLAEIPRAQADIISIIDLDAPFFENISEQSYHDFQNFLARIDSSGIFWVTKPCHIRIQDPRYAQVIGLARVIRSELLIDFATCEVDDEDAFWLVCQAFEKFRTREDKDNLSPDFEYAIEKGVINIGRYFPFRLMDEFVQKIESERMKIVIGTPGRLNTLHWIQEVEAPSLGEHEVEIEMHAVGVNFKDVLVGMNLIDHVGRYHGLEGAGVIRRVGSEVKDFRPGDRVAAMEHNMLSTLLIANEIMCVKIPDSLCFMDAATMFTVYATVQHSLLTVGQLKKGESLLVHSACGGVGLAAIQIAQMIGAKVYATVGSEDKAEYLVRNCNIPRNRIFNSRDNSFVDGVYRETNGKGVDQILNSLSGELLHESWKCVAPYGKLIEIGKRELIGHGRLDMEPFVANRSYCCVDIDAFFDVTMSRFKQ